MGDDWYDFELAVLFDWTLPLSRTLPHKATSLEQPCPVSRELADNTHWGQGQDCIRRPFVSYLCYFSVWYAVFPEHESFHSNTY